MNMFVYAWRITLPLIFLLIGSQALQAQNAMTPMQVAEIEQIGAGVISSDGAYVAYTKIVPANPIEENSPNSSHLFVMNTETGESTQIELDGNAGGLAQRPAHGTFTFLTRMEDDSQNALYELNPETGDMDRLFGFSRNMTGYSWDDLGRRLAFSSFESLDLPEHQLPYVPDFYEEHLPQRRGYIVDLGVADPEPHIINLDGSYYIMSWSPGGTRLAVSVAPRPNVDDQYMFQQIHIIDPTTRNVENKIDNAGKISQVEWSPDGTRLALRAGNSINDPIDGRIMLVDAEGGTPANIFPEYEGKFEQILWTGRDTIHFISSESTERFFGTINPDGSNFTRLFGSDGGVWQSFSLSDAGHIAFVADHPTHPRELFLLRDGSDYPERMTDTNPWLADVAMGVQEVVTYEARDGKVIEGLLIRPVGESEAMRYPLITVVHGGPEAHYSNGWLTGYSLPGQLMAARGFAVFYPNYRGSTGRGLEFIKSSQGGAAAEEFDDIVDGVDYLIETGLVDPDRVGVTGGSYGGYATAWMSTYYSDRFAAGVMFVGISNNLSKWGTSDIPEELYLVHSRERMWESDEVWMKYLDRSPIYHVDKAQTPLLIMHGAEDTRVHPAQSLELYRHIKVRQPDVPLRLILYPNEGHGNVRSTSRFDYNLRMIQWFETYLKGDDPEMPHTHLNLEDFGISVD